MTEYSARLSLPFLLPGQAQKEAFHNEALSLVDALLHAAVEGIAAAPPPTPSEGECWIVGSGATGAWSEQADWLAQWIAGGWRFLPPIPGMSVWDKAAGHPRRWTGTAWSEGELAGSKLVIGGAQVVGARQPAVPSPSGGTIIDAGARAPIDALIVTLKTHGLTD